MAILGDESVWAAEASECAGEQAKFWEYHDKLFDSQSGENQGAFSKDNLKKFAADLMLDTTKFNQCLDTGQFTSLVQSQTQSAGQLGVSSTPTFVINGVPVVGAQDFSAFQKIIDAQLSKIQ